jgi:hypothetical protein
MLFLKKNLELSISNKKIKVFARLKLRKTPEQAISTIYMFIATRTPLA